MFQLFERLFRRVPASYVHPVTVRYEGTRWAEGYLRTGDQLFTDRVARRAGTLAAHAMIFELDGVPYRFIVPDNERRMRFTPGGHYRAYLDAARDRCWFAGQAVKLYVRKPEAAVHDESRGDETA